MSLILTGIQLTRPRWVNDDSLTPMLDPPNVGAAEIDKLWPRSGLLGCDITNLAWIWDSRDDRWGPYTTTGRGSRSPRVISGTCIDINGNPLSGATVKIFDAATKRLVSTATTASDGTYSASTPFSGSAYAVGYLAGSPDVVGVTVRSL